MFDHGEASSETYPHPLHKTADMITDVLMGVAKSCRLSILRKFDLIGIFRPTRREEWHCSVDPHIISILLAFEFYVACSILYT